MAPVVTTPAQPAPSEPKTTLKPSAPAKPAVTAKAKSTSGTDKAAAEKAKEEAKAKAKAEKLAADQAKAREAMEKRAKSEAAAKAKHEAELKRANEQAINKARLENEERMRRNVVLQKDKQLSTRIDAERKATETRRQLSETELRAKMGGQPGLSGTARDVKAPPPSFATEAGGSKEQKLAELLQLYKTDKITAGQYHRERAKLVTQQ